MNVVIATTLQARTEVANRTFHTFFRYSCSVALRSSLLSPAWCTPIPHAASSAVRHVSKGRPHDTRFLLSSCLLVKECVILSVYMSMMRGRPMLWQTSEVSTKAEILFWSLPLHIP